MGHQLVAKCIHPTDVYEGGQEGTRRAVQLGSEESVAGTKNYLAGSIFAASESGPFAYCKGKNHLRTSAEGVTTISVLGPDEASFKRHEQEQLEGAFPFICAGILTLDGAEGHQARSLTVGGLGATVTISNNKPPEGELFVLSMAIGENEAKDISVKDFFAVSNAVLLPIGGRPPTAAMAKVLGELVQPEESLAQALRADTICKPNDEVLKLWLVQLKVVRSEHTTIGEVAEYLARLIDAGPEVQLAIATVLAEVQVEVATATPATDSTKLEAVRGGRFFIEAFKEALRQFSDDDVTKVRGKLLGLEGTTCDDIPTAAALCRAAITKLERDRAVPIQQREGERLAELSPASKVAALRQRKEEFAALLAECEGKLSEEPAGGTSGVRMGLADLVPSGVVVSSNVEILEKLGGFEVAKTVGELRGRFFTLPVVTTGVAAAFADDFDNLKMVAKGDAKWLVQPKPPHNLEKPPASWQEAHDMLGYIINSALATGQDLSLHGCQVRQQRPRGAPQTDITGGQLGLQGPVWKPPYGSAVILRAAKTSEAGQAIAGHISVMLASQVVIEAVHSIMQMWDRDEAESMRAERPIVHSAITRLTQLIQHHQHGGLVRAQVLSNGRSLCELPGKGEASAHGVHLAARVKQILTQVVEDLVGLAASATLRARIASFVEDIFQGTIKRSDVIELCGAMSPDDEDNLHGGRLGSADGPTWHADVERAFKEFAAIGGLLYGDICGARKLTETGRHIFQWVSFAQQAAFLSNKSAMLSVDELLGRLNRSIAQVRADERAPMFQPLEECAAVTRGYMQKAATTDAAVAAATKVMCEEIAAKNAHFKRERGDMRSQSPAGASGSSPGPNNAANRAKKALKKGAKSAAGTSGTTAPPSTPVGNALATGSGGGGGARGGGGGAATRGSCR